MKTIIFSIFLFFLFTTAFSQTEKGKFMIGGNINGNSAKSEFSSNRNKSSVFSVSPIAGYFIANNWSLGLNPNYRYTYHRHTYDNSNGGSNVAENNDHTLLIGPFIRYYKKLGEKIFLYGQLSSGLLIGREVRRNKYEFSETTLNLQREGFYANLTAGIVYFVTPKIGLELSPGDIGYTTSWQKNPGAKPYNDNSLYYSLGIRNLSLGAFVYL